MPKTVGEHLIELLERHGVDTVFGIPGVHTIELYRGLGNSTIKHITPRHEQGAGFMADGYARVSGKPGVALVITGPGLTNTITAMAQAKLDSIPMLVISGVNATKTLGKGLGYLHELPNQQALAAQVSLWSKTIFDPADLEPAINKAFDHFATKRPGPIHIEIPMDVMKLKAAKTGKKAPVAKAEAGKDSKIAKAAKLLNAAQHPVILIGGGARKARAEILALAERLDAPIVQTINARGMFYKHPLSIPASPSLKSVRKLLDRSDCVLAIGTEFGQTDYDMYAEGSFMALGKVIRIDIDPAQLKRRSVALAIAGDAAATCGALLRRVAATSRTVGSHDADGCRIAAKDEIGARYRSFLDVVKIIRDTLPDSIIVGDSTQPIYAANLYYDHDRAGGWFNSSSGYGALGYAPAAALGAALANPGGTTVCLCGDGGFQFSLAEIGAAQDIGAPVIYVAWNNNGYQEIESAMIAVEIKPVGVTPQAPDFIGIARAYGLKTANPRTLSEFATALRKAKGAEAPFLINFEESMLTGKK
ncbi:MAG: 5-guanidino-2-oxopentanoate decarboxylase [Rhizobiaceae bacterium]